MAEANEPAARQEEFLALLKAYTPPQKLARERDMLSGHYRIQLTQPLAELGSPFAKAYVVRDTEAPDAALYALVYDNNIPIRQKNIVALKGFRHPAMVSLLEEGMVEVSTLSEARYVCVLQRPTGQPLSQVLSQGRNPVPEAALIALLRPLTEVLIALSDLGISHNRISLRNVYLAGDVIMLGECISEPSGFSQDALFEPVDRMVTSPWAKADFAISADCYALAVLAIHLVLGLQPFAQLGKEALIDEILTKGSYHALALAWDFPATLQDFFRGLLSDNSRERWDPKTIGSWLAGRRFNLMLPSLPRETSRGFDFAGGVYYNRKALAQNMFRHWQEALALLSDTRLAHWLETSVHKTDAAEAITRIAGGSNPDTARSERHNNELLARIIMVLDPAGPIRLKHLAAAPEGIGLLLAHAFLTGAEADLQVASQMIESDLPGFWAEQQKAAGESAALPAKLQKIRPLMRMHSLGFGMERCLYDLLPSLPCQSPVFKRYRVADLADLLSVLDLIAPQKTAQDDCMDRHIAGFIASRLDINKDLRVSELDMVPQLALHPGLIALKLLVRAQHKAGEPVLRGLSTWLAMRLFPLLSHIHKRERRRKLQLELREKAGLGSLQALAGIVLNSGIFATDTGDFHKTAAAYAIRSRQITELKNNTYLARHARMAGRGIAQTVAFSVCLATVYFTLKSYFHF